MKLYKVTKCSHYREFCGIFSTYEKAEQYMNDYPNEKFNQIEEIILDEGRDLDEWKK